MYMPPAFVEQDRETLCAFIKRYSFGTLISQVDGEPFATQIPLLLDESDDSTISLIGHTALANPQLLSVQDQTVLAIFSGPHCYISPTWYESDNVVPTWNYVAVHVYGKVQIIQDKNDLTEIVKRTTEFYERLMPNPWTFDGSSTFAERMVSQIIGFRLVIERIEGKWKISQNHPDERQKKVISALQERTDENSRAIAALMQQRQP